MQKIKKIGERTKKLSELDLKTVELNIKNGYDDFSFLSEELKDLLEEKLQEKGFNIDDLKISYSLNYSQGDGFSFTGTIKTDSEMFKITRNEYRYSHSNTTDIDFIILYEDEKEIHEDEFTEEQKKTAQEREEWFTNEYKKICKEMEDIGYEIIESQERENILKSGFEEWKEVNGFNDDSEFYDFMYKSFFVDYMNKEKEDTSGYVLVCDSGDTIYRLYLKDTEIKIKDYIRMEIKEYQEKEFKGEL